MRRTRFSYPDLITLLSSPSWLRCEGLIKAFEDAWQRGEAPAIGDYLHADGPERRALLVELVHVELEFRLKAGERVRVETYLAAYPELGGDRRATLDLLAAEYELRQRHEGDIGPDEYRLRFPDYLDDLLHRVPDRCAEGAVPVAPPRVPGYEILEEIGRGGMGVVYKALEPNLGRHVALKFLPLEYARDPNRLDRFLREARTASALNHPHICTVHALGEHAGRPFIVMEFIEGLTLHSLAARRPSVEQVVRLIAQAARALAAAHAAGVVHRDIKPENVMVREDGHVKVLDFGLARRLPTLAGPIPGQGQDTDPGTLMGTIAYMSPEQARGGVADSASDVFSLGIVLYQLTTGHHPFHADSALGTTCAIATRHPVTPSRLNPEIPFALDALLEAMLHKDARLRPTAAEVETGLISLAGASGRHAPVARPGRRIVHRESELATLRAALAEAEAGRGSLVCISGEPGIGKTTLVEDFLAELAGDRPGLVARGHCSERLAGTEAYLPVIDALGDLLRGGASASVARLMKVVAPAWYAQVVGEASQTADGPPSVPSSVSPPVRSQQAMLREFGNLLREASRWGSIVLFFDDLHWADTSTVDLIAYLGRQVQASRVLVIVTYRPTEMLLGPHPFRRVELDLLARGVCTQIPLDFLDRADIDRYLDLAFPGHAFPADFADLIHSRTEGSPLFLVDLLRDLRERGVLAPASDGRWSLVREVPDLLEELPASIRGMIQRLLERLDEDDRRLLEAASVQGHEFDSAVAAAILPMDAAEAEERLEDLDRVHGLVRQVREYEFPDRTLTLRYVFVHAVYQHALYDSLRPTRKATWSARAAQVLLGHHGEKSAAVGAELAFLFEAAREPARAIEYYLQAARNAVRVFAHHEAVELARRGLALLERLPDTPARAQQELTLLLALGVSLVATTGFASAEVEQAYLRARVLCQKPEDVRMLFPVLYGLWNLYLVRCELSRCHDLARELFTLSQDRDDPELLLVAHNVLQQPLFHGGELNDARHHQEQGLALYDSHRHRGLTDTYGEDPGVGCLVYRATTSWQLGRPQQALRAAEAARSLAEELGNPFNVAQALYFGAFTHRCRREARRAQELAEALMESCDEHGFTLLFAGGLILQGSCLAEQGRIEDGIARMRQGLADWRATGALSHRPYHLALLAEMLARAGRIEEASAALAEARTIVAATGERFWEAELHRLQGETLLGAGVGTSSQWAEAEAWFRESLDVARRQKARSLELRSLTSLGRLLHAQGRAAEVRSDLAEILGGFSEGFETADLREAKALLEQLGERGACAPC